MSQSRNAKTSWEALGRGAGARAMPPAAPRSKFAQEHRGAREAPRGDGLQPHGTAYRVACSWFPGFAELPASFRTTLDGYTPLFHAETGPLTLREREVIALAVAQRDQPSFGRTTSHGAGEVTAAMEHGPVVARPEEHGGHDEGAGEREHLIAAFAVKVTRRWLAIDGSDVERLLGAGLPAHAIRAIAETAAVFHFLAEISAAMLLRPRLAGVGRAPIAAVASKHPTWQELSRWLA